MLPQPVQNLFQRSEQPAPAVRVQRLTVCALLIATGLVAIIVTNCSKVPAEPRKFLPADALIAVATDDLGAALSPVIENAAGNAKSARKPDLSALDGIRIAAAITGFEARETPTGSENSVLDLRPNFVAIIETNAWSWQVNSFVEDRIGELINQVYGGDVGLESYPKADGRYYVWTAPDGRRAFAFVVGSLVFLANDEAALEKALNVRSGLEPPLSFETNGEDFAAVRGVVTEAGIGQISNFAAIKLAIESGEDDEVRQFISRALPEAARNAVKEIYWASRVDKTGVEDRYRVVIEPKIAEVLNETLAPGSGEFRDIAVMIPADVPAVTFYNLKDSRIAWRSILLAGQNVSDPLTSRMLPALAGAPFEPYGIADAERFLAAAGGRIATFRIDMEGEKVAATGVNGDITAIRRSLAREVSTAKTVENIGGFTILRSEDYCFAFDGNGRWAVGDCDVIDKAIGAITAGGNLASAEVFARISGENLNSAAAISFSTRTVNLNAMLFVTGTRESESHSTVERSFTTTKFDRRGIIRSTRSDFGLLGFLLEQIGGLE